MTLEHGGNLVEAARQFNIPREQWIDLSTGISPWNWPLPVMPEAVWRTLPQADGELERAAAGYYGCPVDAVLAVPGSQYALQSLPGLLAPGRVAMPVRGYAEHRQAWTAAGHRVVDYVDFAALCSLVDEGAVDNALLINPNNPTGELVASQPLRGLGQRLAGNGGYLVVDEAFMDVCPDASMSSLCPQEGLVVYRSVGKFFGLAGLRLGFMLATPSLCRELGAAMAPWLLSHPARYLGRALLDDRAWQREQRARLDSAALPWLQGLRDTIRGLTFNGTPLFVSGTGDPEYCESLYRALARRAVLVRLLEDIDGRAMVRFGLPLSDNRDVILDLVRESVQECECVPT